MDPDPNPDPAPDLTPFFCDFKDAKKLIFYIFFLITYPQAHIVSLKFNFYQNFASIIYEKREGSGAGSIPLTNGFGRPKNMRILRLRIPNNAYRNAEKKYNTKN
jgi:hypothetical protein